MLEPQTVEGSALTIKKVDEKGDLPRKDNRDNLWCAYCKKPRHTKEQCWKLNGKPTTLGREWVNRVTQSRPRVHLTEQVSHEEVQEKAAFNSEEIEKIRGLLGSLNKPSGACSLTLSGNSWIIDSGATDHMTHTSSHFNTYTPCPSNRKIIVANGSLVIVARLEIFLSHLILSLKMFFMSLNCLPILYPYKNSQKIFIVKLFFTHSTVFFRIRTRRGGLDLLRNKMGCTTLRHLSLQEESQILYLHRFLVLQIKKLFGFIIFVLVIRPFKS